MNSPIFFGHVAEIILEADDLGDGSLTWVAQWTAIRATIVAVGKMFIYPWVGRLSDRVGRRKMILISLYAVGINSFLFAAIFSIVRLRARGLSLAACGVKNLWSWCQPFHR